MKNLVIVAIIALSMSVANAFWGGNPWGGTGPFTNNFGGPAWGDAFGLNDIDFNFRTRNYGRGYGYTDPYANTHYAPYPYSLNYGVPFYGAPYGAAPYGAPYGAPVAPQAPAAE